MVALASQQRHRMWNTGLRISLQGIHVACEEHVSTACVFTVQGVVRDSLRASDAYDLSQLAKVECIKPGPIPLALVFTCPYCI